MDWVQRTWDFAGGLFSRFVERGLQPLREANFYTLAIFLILFGAFAIFISFLRRAGWRWMAPRLVSRRIVKDAHSNPGALGLSYDDFILARRKNPEDKQAFPTENSKRTWCIGEMRRLKNQHFVVTITHTEKDKPRNKLRQFVVAYRELRLWSPQGKNVEPGFIKLDEDCLKELRIRNEYAFDDRDGSDVLGQYNIYLRAAQWYDVRHWLLHPNREIRIAVWVTMITTLLPPMVDQLFGR